MAAILSIILGIIQLILGLRVVLVFFNVTTESAPAIVSTIYDWSVPLVRPFANIVPTYALGSFTFDVPAILAIVVYAVIGGVLIRILRGRS